MPTEMEIARARLLLHGLNLVTFAKRHGHKVGTIKAVYRLGRVRTPIARQIRADMALYEKPPAMSSRP
jgi:hypothetical protein